MHRLAVYVRFFYSAVSRIGLITITPPRILEMQVIATTLLENFEISLPPQNEKTRIYRKPSGLMVPMVEGKSGA